jgi:hypothetical protein
LARLDESIAAFNQRFILTLWNQGNKNVIDTIDAVVIHPTLA